MKKLIALGLWLACILFLVGCAKEEQSVSKDDKNQSVYSEAQNTSDNEQKLSDSDISHSDNSTLDLTDKAFDITATRIYLQGDAFLDGLNADKMSAKDVRHLPIYKFDTLNDANQFKQIKEKYFLSSGHLLSIYDDVMGKYDEAFFAENSLMLVFLEATSSSFEYGVNSVFRHGSTICIHVEQTNSPVLATDAMQGWVITVAVPDSVVEGCTEFDADLDNIK